jgi:hypothetical protein
MTDLGVSSPVGLMVLYWAAKGMKIEELEMATRALGGPLMRRLGRGK